jgi:hypothetical protein
MTLPVILRPAADADIQTTHDDLEQLRAGLGDSGNGGDDEFE